MSAEGWAPGERRWATALALTMLAALLYPVRQNWRPEERRKEGFPLSYYPMFAARKAATHAVRYPVGVLADGSRLRLPGRIVAGGGMNQVRFQIDRVVAEGRVDEFVQVFARKVATREKYADVARVQIVEGTFDLNKYMLEREVRALREDVLAEADVPREDTTTMAEVAP